MARSVCGDTDAYSRIDVDALRGKLEGKVNEFWTVYIMVEKGYIRA